MPLPSPVAQIAGFVSPMNFDYYAISFSDTQANNDVDLFVQATRTTPATGGWGQIRLYVSRARVMFFFCCAAVMVGLFCALSVVLRMRSLAHHCVCLSGMHRYGIFGSDPTPMNYDFSSELNEDVQSIRVCSSSLQASTFRTSLSFCLRGSLDMCVFLVSFLAFRPAFCGYSSAHSVFCDGLTVGVADTFVIGVMAYGISSQNYTLVVRVIGTIFLSVYLSLSLSLVFCFSLSSSLGVFVCFSYSSFSVVGFLCPVLLFVTSCSELPEPVLRPWYLQLHRRYLRLPANVCLSRCLSFLCAFPV